MLHTLEHSLFWKTTTFVSSVLENYTYKETVFQKTTH
jgi:hypothetical protein